MLKLEALYVRTLYLRSLCFGMRKTSVLVHLIAKLTACDPTRPFGLNRGFLLEWTYGGISINTGHISSVSCLVKTFSVVPFVGYQECVISLSLAGWSTSVHTHTCIVRTLCVVCVHTWWFFFCFRHWLFAEWFDNGLRVPQFVSVSVVFSATVLSSLQALAQTSLDAQFVTCSRLHCVL